MLSLPVGAHYVARLTAGVAQSALPDAPVRPEETEAATLGRADLARRRASLALRRLADRVEPRGNGFGPAPARADRSR